MRYSSCVVAPITCSSPRASMGFKMLAASMAPSAAPAPTTTWISSINSMVFLSRCSSSSRLRKRSSKSPRYLVPATMAAISSASTRRPHSAAAARPEAMRCASASASAVLPTPGSPTRQGLFLRRRHKISSMRASSFSRHKTGSNSPSCAILVRSRPYLSLGRLPVRATARGGPGSTSCPVSRRHSRAACGSSSPRPRIHTPAVH